MVKKLPYMDFINQLDSFYTQSKDKYSVYLTFKRVYEEKFKHQNNKKARKQRNEDRINQDKENAAYSVLVRAKLKKNRIQTILSQADIDKFHHILMNIMSLYFIREENKQNVSQKKLPLKLMSKTKRRNMKRLRKIGANKMKVDK
jgi:hypothetical protein